MTEAEALALINYIEGVATKADRSLVALVHDRLIDAVKGGVL